MCVCVVVCSVYARVLLQDTCIYIHMYKSVLSKKKIIIEKQVWFATLFIKDLRLLQAESNEYFWPHSFHIRTNFTNTWANQFFCLYPSIQRVLEWRNSWTKIPLTFLSAFKSTWPKLALRKFLNWQNPDTSHTVCR